MSGGVSVSVRLSPSWRDLSGRFSRSPVAGSVAAGFQTLGRDGVRMLVQATPRRSGRMASSWRSSYSPTSLRLRIYNLQLYWAYVALTGTRVMARNPDLARVIDQELPRMLQTTADGIGRQILVSLKG